ncbi:MAG: hypothetical protein AB7G87_03245 [Clostridia bacterium]
MLVTVSMMSKKKGEIKRFLERYFKKQTDVDDNVIEWIYIYRNLLSALDMIDVVMDNYEDYRISLWVQLGDDDIIEVNNNNRDKVINEISRSLEASGKF